MIILRKHFSEESSNKEKEIKDRNRASSLALGAMAGKIAGHGGKWISNYWMDEMHPEENEKIYNKLKKHAKGKGIEVKELKSTLFNGANLKKKKVTVGGKSATALAHELGHVEHLKDGAGGKFGKFVHKLYKPSRIASNGLVSLANGIDSGMRAERDKRKGIKESKLNRHKSWALPVAASVPYLISESVASRHGLKLLKNAGASKGFMRSAKTNMALAGSTYLAGTLSGAATGEIGRHYGRKLERKRQEFINKNKDKKT